MKIFPNTKYKLSSSYPEHYMNHKSIKQRKKS